MELKINVDQAIIKERSDAERKAALIAFDALQAAQTNTDILFAYMTGEIRKIDPCGRLPLNMKKCSELGLPRDYNYGLLITAVDHYISAYKARYEAMQEKDIEDSSSDDN